MSFVLDSSVALAWTLPDETTPVLASFFDRAARETLYTSCVWPLEVTHTLDQEHRRGRLSSDELNAAFQLFALLDIQYDLSSPGYQLRELLDLARAHRLSTYDASFLAVAMQRSLPLATLDHELIRAARGAGVSVLP